MLQNELAAYFFLVDPGSDAEPNDLEHYRVRASRFNTAIDDLYYRLRLLDVNESALTDEEIQFEFYEVGKSHYGEDRGVLRSWFRDLYLFIWQKDSGVRLGTFVNLMGLSEFLEMLYGKIHSNPVTGETE